VFTLLFRLVPDVIVPWRSALLGGIVTATMVTVGKSLLGIYLGRASFTSAFGAAGSFVVLVVWVYYAAQILLFGAELSRVHARKLEKSAPIQQNAKPFNDEAQEQSGIPHKIAGVT